MLEPERCGKAPGKELDPKESGMSRKGRKTHESWEAAPSEPFISILRSTTKEPAWKAMTFGARALFVLLRSFYNGHNNGRIYLAVRKAAAELGASKTSVTTWFRELEEHGFIRPVQRGFLGVEGQAQASYWRLTEVGYMGEQPTREYRKWQPKNKIPYQKMDEADQKLGQGVPENGTPSPSLSQKLVRNEPVKAPSASQKLVHSTLPCGVGGREDVNAA
jgi:hypothetical protein